jgi:hypothetical protein
MFFGKLRVPKIGRTTWKKGWYSKHAGAEAKTPAVNKRKGDVTSRASTQHRESNPRRASDHGNHRKLDTHAPYCNDSEGKQERSSRHN